MYYLSTIFTVKCDMHNKSNSSDDNKDKKNSYNNRKRKKKDYQVIIKTKQ